MEIVSPNPTRTRPDSNCARATSSFLARLLSRNIKCIEFSASTFKVEFTLTSITLCNSVLSLCDNFRCHYQWPTCRLTVLTTSLAQLCTWSFFSAAILLFHPRTSSASFASAAATSAVFAGRGQSVSQHLLNVSEFQRHHKEDWKIFSHSFLRLLLTVTDPFLNFILTLLTLLTCVWTIRLSYLAMCHLWNRFRPPARAFRVWTTTRFHQIRQRIARHFPRPASQENDGSATHPESVVPRPVPRSARVSAVEPQVAETRPLNDA